MIMPNLNGSPEGSVVVAAAVVVAASVVPVAAVVVVVSLLSPHAAATSISAIKTASQIHLFFIVSSLLPDSV